MIPSMDVLGRRGNTVFMRLPRELWQLIEGGCACNHCAKQPDGVPVYWDTLAVAQNKPGQQSDTTWLVHMPDGRDAR